MISGCRFSRSPTASLRAAKSKRTKGKMEIDALDKREESFRRLELGLLAPFRLSRQRTSTPVGTCTNAAANLLLSRLDVLAMKFSESGIFHLRPLVRVPVLVQEFRVEFAVRVIAAQQPRAFVLGSAGVPGRFRRAWQEARILQVVVAALADPNMRFVHCEQRSTEFSEGGAMILAPQRAPQNSTMHKQNNGCSQVVLGCRSFASDLALADSSDELDLWRAAIRCRMTPLRISAWLAAIVDEDQSLQRKLQTKR